MYVTPLINVLIGLQYYRKTNAYCVPVVSVHLTLDEAKSICKNTNVCGMLYDRFGAHNEFKLCTLEATIKPSTLGSILYIPVQGIE